MDNTKDVANVIAAFLNKHGGNRRMLSINCYEFEVNSIYNVDIPDGTIYFLQDEAAQFKGSARVKQQDPSSKIITDIKVTFNGIAFFTKDIHGDNCLIRVSIDQMKQSNS